MEAEKVINKISERHPGTITGFCDRFGVLEIQVARASVAEVIKILRDDPEFAFDMLIDLVSIDYSGFPGWTGERFGLVYLLKSLSLGHRLQIKATAPEDEPVVPTISAFFQ